MASLVNKRDRPRRNGCDLYRAYDANERLLYVGISVNALNRLAEHNRLAQWPDYIQTLEIEHYDNRAEAVSAERYAIRTERPAFNVEHAQAKADDAPCRICHSAQACTAPNCPKRQFQFIPIIRGEDVRVLC